VAVPRPLEHNWMKAGTPQDILPRRSRETSLGAPATTPSRLVSQAYPHSSREGDKIWLGVWG
jgi:hypothetical protein